MGINIKNKALAKIFSKNIQEDLIKNQNKSDNKTKSNLFSCSDNDNLDKVEFLNLSNLKSTSNARLAQASSAPNGVIDEAVSQGGTGDCWLVSAVISLNSTEAGKKVIKDSIKVNTDGSVTVTFKGANKSYTISKAELDRYDTDSNLVDSYSNGDNDMLALELATEKLFQDVKSGAAKVSNSEINKTIKNSRNIDAGAYTDTMQYILTGKKATIAKTADTVAARYEGLSSTKITNILKDAASKQPVSMVFGIYFETHQATLVNGKKFKISLGDGAHALAITGIDANNKTVTFVNPVDSTTSYTMNWEEFAKLGVAEVGYTQLSSSSSSDSSSSSSSSSDSDSNTTKSVTHDANGNKIVTRTDSNGNVVSIKKYNKSGKLFYSKNNKKGTETTYTYKNNKLESATRKNTIKNTTTEYSYKNGQISGSKTYANDKNKTLKSKCTYENGKVKTKQTYIYSDSGLRVNRYSVYERDSSGRIANVKEYEKNSSGKQLHNYTYTYGSDGKTKTRTDSITGSTKNYHYDSDGNLNKVVMKYKNGTTATLDCNKDGTYANRKTDKYTVLYEYSTGGIRSKAVKYKTSDIGSDGKPKSGAQPVSTITYENGLRKTKTENGATREYTYNKVSDTEYTIKTVVDKDKSGNTTAKYTYNSDNKVVSKITSKYVYIYTYDSNGKRKTAQYKASDCKDGVPKSGAQPIKTS